MKKIKTVDVLSATGIKFYQLEHLVKTGRVPARRFGKGLPREFSSGAIDIIREILIKRGNDGNDEECTNVRQG